MKSYLNLIRLKTTYSQMNSYSHKSYKTFSSSSSSSSVNKEEPKKFHDFMFRKSTNKTKENLIWKKTQAYKNLKIQRLYNESKTGPLSLNKRDKEDWTNFTRKMFGRQYTTMHDKWQLRLFNSKRLKENNKKNYEKYVSFIR